MAGLKKYDARVDALVIETRTVWDPSVGKLEEADREWLSKAIHEVVRDELSREAVHSLIDGQLEELGWAAVDFTGPAAPAGVIAGTPRRFRHRS